MTKTKKVLISIIEDYRKDKIKKINQTAKFEMSEYNTYFIGVDKKGNQIVSFSEIWLTPNERTKSLKAQREKLIKKFNKKVDKYLNDKLAQFEKIENSEIPASIDIDITFNKSYMWGYNPTAEMWTNNGYYQSTSISGCGYDKESTASAQVLNKEYGILKLVLLKLEKKTLKEIKKYMSNTDARELLGYGLNFNLLPYFAGGVGIESHINILKNLGYKNITNHCGRNENYYSFSK